jgi:hypothetical protein
MSSGYAGMLTDDLDRIRDALTSVYRLALDGTAVGRINAAPGFAEAAASGERVSDARWPPTDGTTLMVLLKVNDRNSKSRPVPTRRCPGRFATLSGLTGTKFGCGIARAAS